MNRSEREVLTPMREPPYNNFELQPEPDYLDQDYGSELIESHVEAVEMRDATKHSARFERHRPARRRSNNSGSNRKRSSRHRNSYSDDDDSDDRAHSNGRGIFRYGIVVTSGIAGLAVLGILIVFAVSHGSRSPHRVIEIKPLSTANDVYPTIQPKPQPTRPPVVSTSDSCLKPNQRQQPR